MFDVITIGSATVDVFVQSDSASIVSVAQKQRSTEFMAFPYGSKLEIDEFSFAVGGGAVNTAANFKNLGLNASTIVKIGNDFYAKAILKVIEDTKIDKSNIIQVENETSGFSIILLSFQGDRTVLAHRGTNATISDRDINFEAIKNSKWLYIAPLNGDTNDVLDSIAQFAEEHDVNMAINVGTTSIKRGVKHLEKILQTAEVVVMNVEEASMYTSIVLRPDTKDEKFSDCLIHPDIAEMMKQIKSTHAKIVILTDGRKGAYAFDGKMYYVCPEFPAKVTSTLGAGDAFSSTFVATLEDSNWNIEKSLKFASVNAASVVEHFGAQEGFLTFAQIEEKLLNYPEFKVISAQKIC